MESIQDYRQQYLKAIIEAKRGAAEAIIKSAYEQGVSPEHIYQAIMQPALSEVGNLWMQQKFTVAQEHEATRITEALIAQVANPTTVTNSYRFLVASVYPNQHHLGPYMLSSLLQQAGWAVRNLGASVLVSELRHHTCVFKPHVIGLSVAMPNQVPTLQQAIRVLKVRWPRLPIIVGGAVVRSYPELLADVGADHISTSAAEGVHLALQSISQLHAENS